MFFFISTFFDAFHASNFFILDSIANFSLSLSHFFTPVLESSFLDYVIISTVAPIFVLPFILPFILQRYFLVVVTASSSLADSILGWIIIKVLL